MGVICFKTLIAPTILRWYTYTMIVTRPDNSDQNKPKLIAEIDNGDLEGLNRLMEKYGFVDHQAALRFAMVVLLDAEDNKVYVKSNGVTTVLQPNDQLVKKPQDDQDNK